MALQLAPVLAGLKDSSDHVVVVSVNDQELVGAIVLDHGVDLFGHLVVLGLDF